MKVIDAVLSSLIPGLILVHLLVAPYTKVEESFNIQATHDVLMYGAPTSNMHERLRSTYDHFTFPGAVPRTFVGPVLLAGISQPIITFFGFQHAQLIVRAVLGLFNAAALLVMTHNVSRAFGRPTARWYILLQASQFHIIYYASRTLPNMFAFGLTTLATAFLLPHPNPKMAAPRHRLSISLLVFASVIFRSEIALLLLTTSVHHLLIPLTSLERLLPPFFISFLMALLTSVPLDSYFWQKPLWPELWGFYYNAVLGSSSAWGVSPWHFYFTSALPRLLLNPLVPLVLVPTAVWHPATSRSARQLVIPPLVFAAIYSLQPHKEARFVFYVVPALTAAAAQGANVIFTRRSKSLLFAGLSVILVASILLSFAASSVMLLVSSLNYPGGEALAHLRTVVQQSSSSEQGQGVIPIHADVLSCMTGVTLFGTSAGSSSTAASTSPEKIDPTIATTSNTTALPILALDKTESSTILSDPNFWLRFDYLLAEDTTAVCGGEWEEIGVVQGYAGIEVLRPGMNSDIEAGQGVTEKVVGKGVLEAKVRDRVRGVTGGWWVGPRMVPRVRILRRVKGERGREGVQS